MDDRHGPERQPDSTAFGTREALAVTSIGAVSLAVVIAALAVASVSIGTGLAMPSFPGETVQKVLFIGEADGTQSGPLIWFNITGTESSELQEVGFGLVVNVSCGSPTPYLLGVHFGCGVSLLSEPGSPGEVQLWSQSFEGSQTRLESNLSAGSYLLIVSVFGGTPPEAVIHVTYAWAAQVVIFGTA